MSGPSQVFHTGNSAERREMESLVTPEFIWEFSAQEVNKMWCWEKIQVGAIKSTICDINVPYLPLSMCGDGSNCCGRTSSSLTTPSDRRSPFWSGADGDGDGTIPITSREIDDQPEDDEKD
jgi:hypothetical protein